MTILNASNMSAHVRSARAASPRPPADAPETALFTSIARSTVEAGRADRARHKKEEQLAERQRKLAHEHRKKEATAKKTEKDRRIAEKEQARAFEELNDKREEKRKAIAREARVAQRERELAARAVDEKTAERKKHRALEEARFREEQFKHDLEKMAAEHAKDGALAKKAWDAEREIRDGLRGCELRLRHGAEGHRRELETRKQQMAAVNAKAANALKAVRDREADGNMEVLAHQAEKMKKAEKNKERARKDWVRDREDRNDALQQKVLQNLANEKSKERERLYQLK